MSAGTRDQMNDALSCSGKRVLVVGLGLFGGGVGAARYASEQGATVRVTDLRSETDLAPSLAALEGLDIDYRLGKHSEADFRELGRLLLMFSLTPHSQGSIA